LRCNIKNTKGAMQTHTDKTQNNIAFDEGCKCKGNNASSIQRSILIVWVKITRKQGKNK
jgi:hypothetical protein